jgi:membrane protein implicated in regulation of membrane protease activity
MRKRKRVDWEKELQKTEEIRMKGFRMSLLGFGVAALFIFGASRVNDEAPIFSYVTMIGCFIAATIVLVFTLRRAAKLKKTREEEDKESE